MPDDVTTEEHCTAQLDKSSEGREAARHLHALLSLSLDAHNWTAIEALIHSYRFDGLAGSVLDALERFRGDQQ